MTEKQREEIVELNDVLDAVEDPRECYALVKSKIAEHKLAGEEISEDLILLEDSLLSECLVASQGR